MGRGRSVGHSVIISVAKWNSLPTFTSGVVGLVVFPITAYVRSRISRLCYTRGSVVNPLNDRNWKCGNQPHPKRKIHTLEAIQTKPTSYRNTLCLYASAARWKTSNTVVGPVYIVVFCWMRVCTLFNRAPNAQTWVPDIPQKRPNNLVRESNIF